jgi:DNA-binding CsgD family transcriptional regulator
LEGEEQGRVTLAFRSRWPSPLAARPADAGGLRLALALLLIVLALVGTDLLLDDRSGADPLHLLLEGVLDRWGLTPAERQVALLLLEGLSHAEAARVRDTSERTVRQQVHEVYSKAGLSGRSELAAFFLEDLLVGEAWRGRQLTGGADGYLRGSSWCLRERHEAVARVRIVPQPRGEPQTFNPESTHTRNVMGAIHERAGDTAAGIEAYRKVLAIDPEDRRSYQRAEGAGRRIGERRSANGQLSPRNLARASSTRWSAAGFNVPIRPPSFAARTVVTLSICT